MSNVIANNVMVTFFQFIGRQIYTKSKGIQQKINLEVILNLNQIYPMVPSILPNPTSMLTHNLAMACSG